MICNNNYLADILRVCEIKDLIWVMRFQNPLVYYSHRRRLVIMDLSPLVASTAMFVLFLKVIICYRCSHCVWESCVLFLFCFAVLSVLTGGKTLLE